MAETTILAFILFFLLAILQLLWLMEPFSVALYHSDAITTHNISAKPQ